MYKILVLLLYYDRPIMVKNALESILRSNYQNWQLAFIDDFSPNLGRPIVEEIMGQHLDQVRFYRSSERGNVGKLMNDAIDDSDADIAIILCDDDELCPKYLTELNDFFVQHPEANCCYSHVYEYNPAFELSEFVINTNSCYNAHSTPCRLERNMDASQVAWRTLLNKEIKFSWPQIAFLDASFFHKLDERNPEGVPFSGLISQYKGIHAGQLSRSLEGDRHGDIPDIRRITSKEIIYAIIWHYGQRGLFQEAKRICKIALEIYPEDQLLSNSLKFNKGD